MKEKYSATFFIVGIILNMIKHFYLLLPGIIAMIVGIWFSAVLFLGIGLVTLDLCFSVVGQFQNKKVLESSENPQVKEVNKAIHSKDWRRNVIDLVETRIKEEYISKNDAENEKEV